MLVFHTVAFALVSVVLLTIAGWYGHQQLRRYRRLDIRYTGDHEVVFDREIGFVRPPHGTTRRVEAGPGYTIDYTIFTDATGARVNGPHAVTPPEVTLMTVGCSFAEGYGMANQDTFTERLGRAFEVPVANFAVGSFSGVQALLSLQRHLGLAPKVIVYEMIEDHLRRNLTRCAPNFFPVCLEVPIVALDGPPRISAVEATLLSGTRLSGDIMQSDDRRGLVGAITLDLRLSFYEIAAALRRQSQPRLTDEDKAAAGLFVIDAMRRLAAQIDARLVVLHATRLDGLPASDLSRGWLPLPADFLSRLPEDVVFVDTAQAVADHYAAGAAPGLTLPEGEHPNAIAHGLYAELLAYRLERDGLLRRPPPKP